MCDIIVQAYVPIHGKIMCMCVEVICGRKFVFVCTYKCACTWPDTLISKLQMVVFPSWFYSRSFQAKNSRHGFMS